MPEKPDIQVDIHAITKILGARIAEQAIQIAQLEAALDQVLAPENE